MGFFDFLKRKKAPAPAASEYVRSPEYLFGHIVLRDLCLAKPLEVLLIASQPNATDFIDKLLQAVARDCDRPTAFTATDVKLHPMRIASFPSVIIEMPEPSEIAEPIMVALVVNMDPDDAKDIDPDDISARFFTLEKSIAVEDIPRTVLAEWSGPRTNASHINYGEGPKPTSEAFAQAIANLY